MNEINKVMVVGAGAMGSGIAQISAQSGYEVWINDISSDRLDAAIKKIEKNLGREVESGSLSKEEAKDILSRITVTTDLEYAKDVDIVIEAIIEKPESKKTIFEKLNKICGEDTIFASNTSTVSISELASVLDRPDRFVGVHFFNPPEKMKLLEVISGFFTSKDTMDLTKDFAHKLGKQCIFSDDCAGFIVNHLLIPMLNEAVILIGKGIGSVEDIDKGMKLGCNHPMGPLELIDFIGADITLSIMEILLEETGDSKYRPSQLLRRMVRAQQLGRKTGRGFYVYDEKGRKIGVNIKRGTTCSFER